MPSVQDIFKELDSTGCMLHGIIRPDPDEDQNVLFSIHSELGNSVSIPAKFIKNLIRDGSIRGLGPNFFSVHLGLDKAAFASPSISAFIANIDKQLFEKTNPVKCFDDQGNWVPCP